MSYFADQTMTNDEPTVAVPRKRRAFTLLELLMVLIIIVMLIQLLLPGVQQAREAARQVQCRNNLTQIGLAFANYQQAHSVLPPGCVARAETNGKPEEHYRVSWVAQLLPFLDQKGLHQRINFSQPELSLLTDEEVAKWKEARSILAELEQLRGNGPSGSQADGSTETAVQPESNGEKEPVAAAGSELVIAGRITDLESRLQEIGFSADKAIFGLNVQAVTGVTGQLSVLHCPSSPNSELSFAGAHNSSKVELSDQADGLLYVNSSESLTTIPDGASQTILAGEHVAVFAAGQSKSWLYAGAATLRNGGAMTSAAERAVAAQPGGLVFDFSQATVEERLRMLQGLSSLGSFGSFHSSDRVHFLFADGAIKPLSRSTDPTVLSQMINRHDGF